MIIYLKYPRKRGFFSWDELSLVARTLGNFPAFITCETEGIAAELLLKLVCDNTYLHGAVDATANFHFFPWNISTIHKAILLLNERLLTFAEIHLVRVAYLFYEGSEAKGLPLDGNILQKTLKLCGRMISPQKMSHRLCHMIPRLQEPGFLQLHEFLDLVLWTELYNPQILKEAGRLRLAKDGEGCFQMSDFEELLQTVDDRLVAALDLRYEVDECIYSELKSTRDAWKQDVTESYINPTFRLIRVPKARSDFGIFTKALNQSRRRTKQSKFGYSNRPTTAPPLKVTQSVKKNSSSKIQMVHEHSHLWKAKMVQQNPSKNQIVQMDSTLATTSGVQEQSMGCKSKPRVMSSSSAPDDARSRRDKTEFLPHKASAFSKYRIPSIVTDEDLQKTSQLIEDLKFDEATLASVHGTEQLRTRARSMYRNRLLKGFKPTNSTFQGNEI